MISASLSLALLGMALGASGVVLAGVVLVRSGDVIASTTRMGGLWFGMVFLALATSLPELVTAATAVRIGAPDLAAGDLFGSNMANMLLLALVTLLPGSEVFRRAALDQVLAAAHAVALTALAAAFIVLAPSTVWGPLGPGSPVILLAYLAGSRAIYRHSALARAAVKETESIPTGGEDEARAPSLQVAVLRFLAGTMVVVVAAPLFTLSTNRIVGLTGLGESFVGVVVLGVATSLPEAATSLAAVRLGQYDLAVSNLFGSNAVNMAMFFPLDLVQSGGPILAVVHDVHVVAALASIVMMALAMSALVYRATKRFTMLEPSSGLIMIVYVIATAIMFAAGD